MTATHVTIPRLDQTAAVRRNPVYYVSQMLFRVVCALWLRLRVRGLERLPRKGGALFLSNHQSFLDPLVIGVWVPRPVSYLARDNLFRVPVVGWVLKHTCVMPINREGGGAAAIRETLKRLDEGFLVGIFPEGTRSSDGALQEFKPGFAALVRRTDLPIIPVGVAGADKALGRGDLFLKPCKVCVVFGEPLPAAELVSLRERGREDDLVAAVRARIAECQREAEALRQGPTRIKDGG